MSTTNREVYVNKYTRRRFGQTEQVREHWRGWPNS